MKFEFTLPDDTSAEVVALVRELIDRLEKEPASVTSRVQTGSVFEWEPSPDQLKQIQSAREDIAAGNYVTERELDLSLAERRAIWIKQNPHSA